MERPFSQAALLAKRGCPLTEARKNRSGCHLISQEFLIRARHTQAPRTCISIKALLISNCISRQTEPLAKAVPTLVEQGENFESLRAAIQQKDGRKARRGRGSKNSQISRAKSRVNAKGGSGSIHKPLPPRSYQQKQNPLTMLVSDVPRDLRPQPPNMMAQVAALAVGPRPTNEQITRNDLNRLAYLIPDCNPQYDSAAIIILKARECILSLRAKVMRQKRVPLAAPSTGQRNEIQL